MTTPSFLDIFHLELRYPIFERICIHLPIASIIALTQTCRGLSGLYQALIPLQWNVDRLLSRFVRNPHRFRSRMGKSNAIVSGSVALQFFERVVWKDSDLDIYICEGRQADAFEKYLTEEEGYKMISANPTEEYPVAFMMGTRTFTKWSERDSVELRAQIILTYNMPIQVILRSFHSTAVVNIFTWNKAYAIFPLPTFVHHKGYLLKPLDNYLSGPLEKYSRRGWRFQETMWPEDKSSNQPIQDTRRIGDKFTWMIPFDTSNVDWSKTPDFVLEYSNFRVNPKPRGEEEREEEQVESDSSNYEISASRFEAKVLRHDYLYGTKSWMEFLGKRVDKLTILELYKLSPALRPPHFQGPLQAANEEQRVSLYSQLQTFFPQMLPNSVSWTYWDDEIPQWYEAWQQLEAQLKKGISTWDT